MAKEISIGRPLSEMVEEMKSMKRAIETKWPYEPSMLEKRNELVERYRHLHQIAESESAELRAEKQKMRQGLADVTELLERSETQRESLEGLVLRARAIIRNQHLKEKPSHRNRMDCRSTRLGPVAGQEKLKDWCVTCAVLIEMEMEGGGQ